VQGLSRPGSPFAGLLVAGLLIGLGIAACQAQTLPRTVLVLDESGPSALNPGYTEITRSFRSSLMSQSPVQLHMENLDVNNFFGKEHQTKLRHYLAEKYHDISIGVLVAVGSAALEFALQLRSERWPHVPIVFAAADGESAERLLAHAPTENVTGRSLRFSLTKSVHLARMLVPGLKQVALVGDPLEKQPFRRHFKDAVAQAMVGLTLLDLTGLPLQEVKERISALPDHSVILYTALTNDGAGTNYIPQEASRIIAGVANRPVLVDIDNRIGLGATGGIVVRPALIGAEAARAVGRIFSGEAASAIPIADSEAMQPIFDWRQLKRWGISESRLPPGSEVWFRPQSVWELYQAQILSACVVVLIQATLIAWLLYERSHRRRSEAAAHELSGRLIIAQEQERARLARELHDDLTQRLAVLAIEAGREDLKPTAVAGGSMMGRMRESLIRLSEDVHALAYRLHPSILEELGLREALKSECEHFARMSSLTVDVSADGIPERVPHEVALCLFRVAQECLRNIARHASATAARIRVWHSQGRLHLLVTDNGVGFDPAQQRARPSLGHASMRQRVALLGGKLTIDSEILKGTTISVWVPIKESPLVSPLQAAE
jgi:signal transduction histidine kinase